MVDETVRQEIQQAYSGFLEKKALKPRYGQKLMIAEIARALDPIELGGSGQRINDAGIAVVEAGTGTGKTVAYILAALPFAKKLEKKLIVSTATITLQSQIMQKDLPDILENTGIEFRFGLAKGRGRYLCLTKLAQIQQEQDGMLANMPLFTEDLAADQKAQKFFNGLAGKYESGDWAGDKDSLDEEVNDRWWSMVTATHRECTNRRCSQFKNCAYFKARQDLEDADIIVANHDLVLADLALGGGAVLPGPHDSIYIFDEAHHLADKALSHFAAQAELRGCLSWLEQWGKTQKKLEKELMHAESLRPVYLKNEQLIAEAENRLRDLWALVQQVSNWNRSDFQSSEPKQHRFIDGRVPEELREMCAVLRINFSGLTAGFTEIDKALRKALTENPEISREEAERWYPVVGSYFQRCENYLALFKSYEPVQDAGIPVARWIELVRHRDAEDFRLQSSPILAANTLDTVLWQQATGAILTSATLSAAGKFDRFRMQSGVPEWAGMQQVPSPFDYRSNAEFIVPPGTVDASDAVRHTQFIIKELPALIQSEGGCLVLFSSRRQMNEVMEGLDKATLARCLVQNQASRHRLLNLHKEAIDRDELSCLVGLASFAEGIDLPGKYLQTVIIAKLPFATPDSPIDAALSDWVEKRGGNAFMQLTLPDACIKLVQASGRLIRTESDTGKVYLLDNRVYTKRYGAQLLSSLPPYTLKRETNYPSR